MMGFRNDLKKSTFVTPKEKKKNYSMMSDTCQQREKSTFTWHRRQLILLQTGHLKSLALIFDKLFPIQVHPGQSAVLQWKLLALNCPSTVASDFCCSRV
jgi:hypothetical protein